MESTTKLPGVFALIKQSFSFYKKNYKKLITLGSVIVGLFVVEFLIQSVFFPGEFNPETLSRGSMVFFIVMMIVFGVVNVVAQIFMQIAFMRASHEFDTGSSISVKDLLKGSSKFFWPFIWINILAGLVVIGAAPFLFIPALILSVYLSLDGYALVVDNKRGLNALTTSFHYIRKNWWRVFWRFFGLGLIVVAIGLIVAAIVVLILSASGSLSFESFKAFADSVDALAKGLDSMPVVAIIISIVSYFLSYCVITPLFIFYSYAIYKGLKAKKAAPDHSTELKKARGWFMGLSIFGLIVPVLLVILSLSSVILISLNRARTLGEQSQMNSSLQQNSPQSTAPVSIVFPTKAEPFVTSPLTALEAQPMVSKEYFFSMRLPKGWTTEDAGEALAITDPTNEIDVSITVSPRNFSEVLPANTSEVDRVKHVANVLLKNRPLDNIVFRKVTMGATPAYVVEGSVMSEGVRVNVHYYLVPDGQNVYLIIAAFVNNPNDLKVEQAVVDSISTFKIVE